MLTSTDWRRIFSEVAKNIGWTPDVFGSLSIAQLDGLIFDSDAEPKAVNVNEWRKRWEAINGIQVG